MIYLHVPFCKSFCTYCDFYSEICPKPGSREKEFFNEYADAVYAELREREEEISMNISSAASAGTLYIGGGTPSVLPLDVLVKTVEAIRRFAFKESGGEAVFKEFTIEVNPEDIVEKGIEYVSALLDLGVDRISMGVQSFEDPILKWMNRRHTSQRAKEAYDILRRAERNHGRKPLSVSVDLIFGFSHLSDEVWEETIDQAVTLGVEAGLRGPEHISAYQLSIEEGSALASMVERGLYTEASEDLCRRQYDLLCSRLRDAGYRHYEISNFALPGHEAVHNSAYWKRIPYVGLGPGAHSLTLVPSQEGDSSAGPLEVRSWNSHELPQRKDDGTTTAYSRNKEVLSQEDIRIERIMLPLRTAEGLSAAELYSLAPASVIDSLLSEGALEIYDRTVHLAVDFSGSTSVTERRIRIPESRFFTSDEIIRELI